MTSLVTAEQMRSVEDAVISSGTSVDELSDRAARAIVGHVLSALPPDGLLVVVAGPGNNGLDALKVHALARETGAGVSLHCWRRQDCSGLESSRELTDDLKEASVVLDGLFGSGLARDVEGEPAGIVRAINSERERRERAREPLTVVSVDVPSGLSSDTGAVMGVAVQADLTITLGLAKVGLYTGHGPQHAGVIVREGIGLDDNPPDTGIEAFDESSPLFIPSRRIGSHKNDNGRVLVMGGSLSFPMAPVMAARAAQRAGAGYVTVAFPRSMLSPIASHLLEQTLMPLPEAEVGALGGPSVEEAENGAQEYRALVLGNGLGREDQTVEFVLELLGAGRPVQKRPVGFRAGPPPQGRKHGEHLPPVLVDGDGLYALSQKESWWEDARAVSVLTPHPGEMGRLVDRSAGEVEADRFGIAREAAQRWGKVVLLKGAYPLVASPDGRVVVLTAAHPELGSAGTGDVLAGVCGFLLALGLEPTEAARSALILGSRAATIARERVGRDCVSAGDLIEALPEARRSRDS